MRSFLLSTLVLASAFQTALGAVEGQWTYIVENGGATITASVATGAVTIPSVLGGYAVKNVGNGSSVIFGIPNTSVTSVTIPSSVTSIGDVAFTYCRSLNAIAMPNSVTSIGLGAFESCSSLTSVTIPNSVTSIGERAFLGCSSLTSIVIPATVTSIRDRVFSDCTSLASITIPDSVTSIGEYAFASCSDLTSITIPNSVTSIGFGAFLSCTKLGIVYLPARFVNTYTNFGLIASQVNYSYTLATSCNPTEGTLLVDPIKSTYQIGDIVTIIASPKAGYLFGNWSGASIATTSSITLTMDADKTMTASFIQDGRDADGDGLTNYQESITYGTNPNQKDTNSDGVEDGQAVALGYSPTSNFSALINHLQSHPPAGLYTATQMQAMAFGDLVLTKNSNGSFTLNYDIEKSTDLQTWTPYQAFSLPLNGLPTDKAFVRIKAKQQ